MDIYEGSAIAFISNGKIMLHKRSADNKSRFGEEWGLVGGRIEDNETPEDALERELVEELGYKIKEYKFYKIFEEKNNKYHVLIHLFISEFPGLNAFKSTFEGDITKNLQLFSYEECIQLNTAEPGYRIFNDLHKSGLLT